MSEALKSKCLKGLVWITMVYFLFTSVTNIEMAIHILGIPYILDDTNNYFLVSLMRIFFSSIVLLWTLLALFYYLKETKKFKNVFINVCIIYGFAQCLYVPVFYYKSADPNYFNYFLWAPIGLFENLAKSIFVFIVAILASKYFIKNGAT